MYQRITHFNFGPGKLMCKALGQFEIYHPESWFLHQSVQFDRNLAPYRTPLDVAGSLRQSTSWFNQLSVCDFLEYLPTFSLHGFCRSPCTLCMPLESLSEGFLVCAKRVAGFHRIVYTISHNLTGDVRSTSDRSTQKNVDISAQRMWNTCRNESCSNFRWTYRKT